MATVTVQVGSAERSDSEITPSWITDQVNARRRAGEPLCVRVLIFADGMTSPFATSGCGRGGGMQRPLTGLERQLLDEWRKHHLDEKDFAPGNLHAFVQAAKRLI